MILCCLFPEFPAVAAWHAMHAQAEVLVVARGRVIARSPGLRTAGIDLGEHEERARALVPSAVIIERHPAVEYAVWEDILGRCAERTPYLQSLRPGLLMADVRTYDMFHQLLMDTGGQGGVASTRTMALLGAMRSGRGRIVAVSQDDISRFLAVWPVELLRELDITQETIDRMKLFGLTTMAMLRMLTRRHLEAQFGMDGLRIHDLLATISTQVPVPLYTPPPVIEEDIHFENPQREPAVIEPHMLLVLAKSYERLGRMRCTMLEVRARDRLQGIVIRAQRILKRPAETCSELQTTAIILLRDIIGPQRYCSSIGIALKGIVPPQADQLSLFEATTSADDVARAVLRRYPDGVVRARVVAADAYLPEHRFVTERWTPLRGDTP